MAGVDPGLLSAQIVDARAHGRLLPAPVEHGLGPADAYAIQASVLAPRMASGGGRGGWKLGYTSAVMREQMGIAEPNHGPLAHAMIREDDTVIGEGVTQPRVEPEIAAVIGHPIPVGSSLDDVRGAVAEWRIALEIVDSVWQDYRFDWALNTADGSSAAFAVVGGRLDAVPASLLSDLEVELLRNDEVVGSGRGAAAMGDPALALHWLAQRESLVAGDVVITGGLTAAVPFEEGDTAGAVARFRGDVIASVTARR